MLRTTLSPEERAEIDARMAEASARRRKEADARRCGENRVVDAGLCYDRCRDGYDGVGPVCWGRCLPGYTNGGALCTNWKTLHTVAKASYGRGVGTIPRPDPVITDILNKLG